MSKPLTVAVIVGSLRRESINRRLAQALAELAAPGLELSIVEIGDLPLYNQDLEGPDAPAAWTRFREEVKRADAVLFVTPEYNRSVPGSLKNAIDVGSRPYGDAAWTGKPAAIISTSMGALGGFGANHHLRQMLVFFDMAVLQQPEAYIGNSGGLFDDNGKLASEDTRAFLGQFLAAFQRLAAAKAAPEDA